MTRHGTQQTEPISFFAFLSIVSCAIGLLMFVLAGVSVVSFWGAEQIIMQIPQTPGGKLGGGRVYVECGAEGLIVHPHREVVSGTDLDDPQKWIETPFGKCLTKLTTGTEAGSIYFLVRPKGMDVFRKALGYCILMGGGTSEAVAQGRAKFSMGQQLVLMPGPLRVVRELAKQTP